MILFNRLTLAVCNGDFDLRIVIAKYAFYGYKRISLKIIRS